MNRYTVSDRAREDIKGIYRYIAGDNVAAARRLRTVFLNKFRLLAEQPLMGESRNDLASNLRMFVSENYVLLYRPSGAGIEIVRVVHAARDLAALWQSEYS
jgi:toxin ParE1/3/4